MSVSITDTVTPNELVAAEIWACLGRRRVSANRAAAALGWKQTYLSRRLTGSVPFSVPDLYALAHLLRVPVTQFMPPFEPNAGEVINVSISPLRIAA